MFYLLFYDPDEQLIKRNKRNSNITIWKNINHSKSFPNLLENGLCMLIWQGNLKTTFHLSLVSHLYNFKSRSQMFPAYLPYQSNPGIISSPKVFSRIFDVTSETGSCPLLLLILHNLTTFTELFSFDRKG